MGLHFPVPTLAPKLSGAAPQSTSNALESGLPEHINLPEDAAAISQAAGAAHIEYSSPEPTKIRSINELTYGTSRHPLPHAIVAAISDPLFCEPTSKAVYEISETLCEI
ncbi:hypothetical protein FF1_003801 [Malus domestica]